MEKLASEKSTPLVCSYLVLGGFFSDNFGIQNRSETKEIFVDHIIIPGFRHLTNEQTNIYLGTLEACFSENLQNNLKG